MKRRDFFQGLLAGGAAFTAARHVAAAAAADSCASRDATEVLPLIAPLSIGAEIGLGWRLVALSGVDAGAAAMTLRKGTRFARLHICRRDGRPRGMAHSDGLDFLLMNDGDGANPTDEGLARAVNVLSQLVTKNERAGARVPQGLLSHAARLEAFASCGKLA